MQVLIKDLDKAALNWAVASLLGVPTQVEEGVVYLLAPSGNPQQPFNPITDWQALGPLIRQHQVFFRPVTVRSPTGLLQEMVEAYVQPTFSFHNYRSRLAPEVIGRGQNHEVAACRCIVSLHKGDSIEIPEPVVWALGSVGLQPAGRPR